MIEILISLLLLSMLFLGFDSMQVTTLRATYANYYFFVADRQIIAIEEELRAKEGRINQRLLSQWQRHIETSLPQGKVSVQDNYPYFQIIVSWGKVSLPCSPIKLGRSGCLQTTVKL